MTHWKCIIPFNGRNHSGASQQNFLCQSGNVYVMDNHRAALWCWLQHVDLKEHHSLIHIDRHYDTLQSQLYEWMQHLPDWSDKIDDYLGKTYRCGGFDCPVIRWDNYLSIYLEEFGTSLKTFRCLTHDEGDVPNFEGTMNSPPWDLPVNMAFWLDEESAPWIINIDLDYFFYGTDGDCRAMFSDDYLETFCKGLKDAMDRSVVSVVTLCLTPDSYTPGWEATEALATRLLDMLGLQFSLPSS